MPYASKAQAAKFHSDPKLRKFAPEFDAATDFSKLPAKVGVAAHARKGKPVQKHHRKKRASKAALEFALKGKA